MKKFTYEDIFRWVSYSVVLKETHIERICSVCVMHMQMKLICMPLIYAEKISLVRYGISSVFLLHYTHISIIPVAPLPPILSRSYTQNHTNSHTIVPLRAISSYKTHHSSHMFPSVFSECLDKRTVWIMDLLWGVLTEISDNLSFCGLKWNLILTDWT